MADTTPARRARNLLALLHLLKPDTRHELSALAEMLCVSPAQAAAELELLACCGTSQHPNDLVPVIVEDGYIEVFGALPALDRPVRLSSSEAAALVAALQAAGLEAGDPLVTKLIAATASPDVTTDELARLVTADVAGGGSVLETLALAAESRRALRLVYQSAGAEETTERIVEPLALVNDRGTWYLEAYCRRAGALRTFRSDRIQSAEMLAEVFTPESAPLGVAFSTAGLPKARVRLDAGEEFTAREWPGARLVEQLPDGATVVEVPFAGTDWIARQVLGRLGRAEALSPPEVRQAVAELARAELVRLGRTAL